MIAAQMRIRRHRILRPAAGLDFIGVEACPGGVVAPRDQDLRGGFRCYARVLRGFSRHEHGQK
jgi:hypothetical protein